MLLVLALLALIEVALTTLIELTVRAEATIVAIIVGRKRIMFYSFNCYLLKDVFVFVCKQTLWPFSKKNGQKKSANSKLFADFITLGMYQLSFY
jgi:hypothetical protein